MCVDHELFHVAKVVSFRENGMLPLSNSYMYKGCCEGGSLSTANHETDLLKKYVVKAVESSGL